jgi:hypothetical protein
MDRYFQAALKLHRYLIANHWRGQTLIGPDSGIRFNYRIGRFLKSYLRALSWKDDYCYLQAQGYWTVSNWQLFVCTGDVAYQEIALQCSAAMLQQQRDDGAWVYPNREWKGRIATAEGTWGSLGLLETYRQTAEEAFLDGALRWRRFLVDEIGFQRVDNELAVNYFAHRDGARVPNNSAFVLRFMAELADVTGDETHLELCDPLITFLRHVQDASGEFPYAVNGETDGKHQSHFQCYQYNAFQCLDLMRYYEITRAPDVLPLISHVLEFLCRGQADDGHALYACDSLRRRVTYHTAALGAAFLRAHQMGIRDYQEQANRAYAHLLRTQRADGSFPYSQGDYYLLYDRRPYPRNLSMILHHLLLT